MAEAARREAETFGQRLHETCALVGTKKTAAEIMGVSEDMVYRYCRELTKPPFMPIAALCRAAGVRVEWLAFGDMPMMVAEVKSAAREENALEHLDRELLGSVIAVLESVLDEAGYRLDPVRKGKAIPLLYRFAELTEHDGERLQFARDVLKSL